MNQSINLTSERDLLIIVMPKTTEYNAIIEKYQIRYIIQYKFSECIVCVFETNS